MAERRSRKRGRRRQQWQSGRAAIYTNIDFDWEAINGSSSVDVSVGSSQGPRCRFVRCRALLYLSLAQSLFFCLSAPFVWLVLLVILLLFFAFLGGIESKAAAA